MASGAGGDRPGGDDRAGRQHQLVVGLQVSLALVVVTAVVGLVAPGSAGSTAATVGVAVLVAAPLGRVAWLSLRWIRRHDLRFAAAGVALLTIAAAASALAG